MCAIAFGLTSWKYYEYFSRQEFNHKIPDTQFGKYYSYELDVPTVLMELESEGIKMEKPEFYCKKE